MQILQATEKDIPELVQLINSAYRGKTSKQGWTTEAELLGGIRTSDELLLADMKLPGVNFLKVINDQQQLMACVFLQTQEDALYLGMLTVSPRLQNNGIGKLLLQEAERFATAKSLRSIKMTVISARTELLAWYEKHGYKRTGVSKPFVEGVHVGKPVQPLVFLELEKII
jgi:ribosomal protein S18 acetylase RimI-like enzyme